METDEENGHYCRRNEAEVTRVRTRVRAHVNDELARLDERFPAIGALVRPLARVDPHVPVQFAAVLEAAAAVRAAVRLLLRVDPPVDAQVLLDRERLAAHLAHERPLTCTGDKNTKNLTFPAIRDGTAGIESGAFVTMCTCVRSVVAGESGRNGERFAAHVAAMGFLTRCRRRCRRRLRRRCDSGGCRRCRLLRCAAHDEAMALLVHAITVVGAEQQGAAPAAGRAHHLLTLLRAG